MAASNFNLRGVSGEAMESLKREAERLHISVNTLMLQIIEKGVGVRSERRSYHELDHLAGTWSAKEMKLFEENTQIFEQIDEELWK